MRKRTTWLFLVFSMLYVAVAGRLVYLQVLQHDYFASRAAAIRFREIAISASRGSICDRYGRPLAVNIETASVFANRREMSDPSRTAIRVAALLDKEPSIIEEKLSGGRNFVWLGRQIDARIGDEVWKNRTRLPGIGIQRDTKRVYPAGSLAAQVVGFTNIDNGGAEGIESVSNSLLSGIDGKYRAELDSHRRVIPETRHVIREPEDGKDVYLTIDTTIQHIAEQALAKMAGTYSPSSACAVVLDPATGEILALANYPTYDPNNVRKTRPPLWRNRAVADLYEPGSTLKMVTASAALNEGISPRSILAHCTGCEKMKGGRIRCTLHRPYLDGHGGVDMFRMIEQSCNIAAAHVALRLGSKKLYKYEKAFGLLDRPDTGFGCEAVGYIESPDKWRPIRLANIGFGQGLAVTPLQMASVYATIANGGVRVEPKIVREVRNSDGSIYKAFTPGKKTRVISEEAARMAVKLLKSCVDSGTGKAARIDGRTVAGKTGSAQIAKTNGRGYEPGAYIASFMGFAPASSPRLAIAVVVNRPKGSHWGATVAGPVFQEIGEKALWYLKVPSDAPSNHEIKQKREEDLKRMAQLPLSNFLTF
ncbi:MAG: penicillin-binding protein 2 [Armatimonadota bacterium]|nr:penicillin-binding protein 2 [bacterium]